MISNYKISIINQATDTVNSESIMRELVDSVILEFNKYSNITLNGQIERLKVTNINWGWADSNEPLRICEINIEILETIETL